MAKKVKKTNERRQLDNCRFYDEATGWKFILRDKGVPVKASDYKPVGHSVLRPLYTIPLMTRHFMNKKPAFRKVLRDAIASLHCGGFIDSYAMLHLCTLYNLRVLRVTSNQLRYIAEMDVSMTTIRYKDNRRTFKRGSFNGVFNLLAFLAVVTYDDFKDGKIRWSH